MVWRWGRYFIDRFLILVLCLFCLNVIVLSVIGHYDVRIGFLHFTAHGLFKPVLMMSSCFILALMVGGILPRKGGNANSKAQAGSPGVHILLTALIPLSGLALYYGSTQVNFSHHDWTHRHISEGLNSVQSILRPFITPQADGFYRPLTFLSLWIDYRLFGTWYPGYHLQSIAMHMINSLLVVRLARMLRFERTLSLWAGLIYSAAAVHFEPVMWPAARFDLLATGFTLGALVFAIRYFSVETDWEWTLPASLFCFVLAIMSKESGYCFPLLIFFILCTYRVWSIPRPRKNKAILYFSLAVSLAITMILVRVAIYGSLGGYPSSISPEAPHFSISLRTFMSLMKVLPISVFGVNTTSAAPGWLPAVLLLFALFILATGIACRGCCRQREFSLVACTFLAAIPVVNIAGWIGSSMQHSRYLYMPAIFSILMLVSLLGKVRRAGILLGIYFLVNAIGVLANVSSYRHMLERSETIAESVRMDYLRQASVRTICLLNLPENPDGIFFFGSEVAERIERKIPGVLVVRLEPHEATDEKALPGLIYRWSHEDRALYLVRK